MSNIFYCEPELVIALNRCIIFVNPNDLQIFNEVVIPDDLAKCGLKITQGFVNEDEEEPSEIKQTQTLAKCEPTIQHVKMSPDHKLLAVTTVGQKALLLYNLRLEHAQLISIRTLARASSALCFSSDSKRLLVTDKTGDCYEYDCVQHDTVAKLILGHLSIVYDVLWSNDEKFIVTCDRDDKIRVTNYPETYDIHSYCLGHKEFVAKIQLLNDDVLISISGDKTLKLWNFREGKELISIELPAPGIKFAIKPIIEGKWEIAVLLHQPNECVSIFELIQAENKQWNFNDSLLLTFDDMICCNLCYAQDRLYVTGVKNDNFTIKIGPTSPEAPLNWTQMVEEQFKNYSWTPEDVSSWFKKRYDNVSAYMERKRQRLEEKSK